LTKKCVLEKLDVFQNPIQQTLHTFLVTYLFSKHHQGPCAVFSRGVRKNDQD